MSKPTINDSCSPFLADERLFYESLKVMDDRAFSCLYKRIYSPCLQFALKNSGSADEAYDHLHTTLERFIYNIRQGAYVYRQETKVSTYFIEVFRRSWLQYLAQRNRLDRLLADAARFEDNDSAPDFSDMAPTNEPEEITRITEAMDQLSTQCRTILELFYVYELAIAQIAEQMKLTPESAKNQLYRCRKYLRGSFGN